MHAGCLGVNEFSRMPNDVKVRKIKWTTWNDYGLARGTVKPPSSYTMKRILRLEIPVDTYPNFNFVGWLLGLRGNSLKRVEAITGCCVYIRGKGQKHAGFHTCEHLNDPLHILIEADLPANIVDMRLRQAQEINEELLKPVVPLEEEFLVSYAHAMRFNFHGLLNELSTMKLELDDEDSTWVVDTSMSFHITTHRDFFSSYTNDSFGWVMMGNEAKCEIIGMGDVSKKLALARRKKNNTLYKKKARLVKGEVNIVENEASTELWHKWLSHIRFHVKIERQTGKGPFEQYCRSHGIRLEKIRMNRTICDRIRCMVSHAKLLKSFRGKAMRITTDLINLVLTRKFVSFEHLRVFGCRAFVHCIFLGYSNEEFGEVVQEEQVDTVDRNYDSVVDDIEENPINKLLQSCLLKHKVLLHDEKKKWLRAMHEEMKSLHKNKGKRALKNKWVLKRKPEPNRSQLSMNLEIEQLDVKTTFLHGDLKEEIYIEQLEGFTIKGKEHLYKKFDPFIVKHGYDRIASDHYKFNMGKAKPVSSPLGSHLKLSFKQSPLSEKEKEEMRRCPMHQPWGYTDADMAGDVDSRKSTSSYLIIFSGRAVSWQSKLQKCVALSTTEAEYIAITEASKELPWMKKYLLYCDSQSAIHLNKNPTFHSISKHIDVRYHWIRDALDMTLFCLEKIHIDENGLDMMTKPIPIEKLQLCRKQAGLVESLT
ncbi:hypothetical protein AAG906_029288 [Vitis piasezkii]